MDQTIALYFLPAILFALIISKLLISSKNKRNDQTSLPPSPPSLPFIGHLHLLKEPIHRTLQTLSHKYGPIFSLTLGVRRAIVVSSPALADECLNKNGAVFADRPHGLLGWKIIGYNCTALGHTPYGPHWRNLRRLSTVELLSTARLNSFLHVRQDEVQRLVNGLVYTGSGFREVEMRSRLMGLSMNIVMRMVAGKRYFGTGAGEVGHDDEGQRFKKLIRESFDLSGTTNPVDFLPVLRWVDFSGLEGRMWAAHKWTDEFFQRLIEEHRRSYGEREGSNEKTMIDTMLNLQEAEPQVYTDEIIKGQIMAIRRYFIVALAVVFPFRRIVEAKIVAQGIQWYASTAWPPKPGTVSSAAAVASLPVDPAETRTIVPLPSAQTQLVVSHSGELKFVEVGSIHSDYTRVAGTLVRKSDTRHLAGATAHCLFASDLDDRNTKILQLEHQLKEGHEGSNQELQEELSKDHEAADTKKDAELAVVREELKQAKEDTKHF
ncbi:unnamed protein product [Linum tenue]|uniref:Cytochrome P450 n=1 Tax=Linum tenue TaxID=586396 RepID=A0AAV0P3K2_9ROSI|nr:unnamed protein product [Linum tenue]